MSSKEKAREIWNKELVGKPLTESEERRKVVEMKDYYEQALTEQKEKIVEIIKDYKCIQCREDNSPDNRNCEIKRILSPLCGE